MERQGVPSITSNRYDWLMEKLKMIMVKKDFFLCVGDDKRDFIITTIANFFIFY